MNTVASKIFARKQLIIILLGVLNCLLELGIILSNFEWGYLDKWEKPNSEFHAVILVFRKQKKKEF